MQMAEERENLAEAFASKEKNEKLLSNLDKLQEEGSIKSDLYTSMKADYEHELDASLQEINQIKGYFKKQADTLHLERDIYQRELAKLETRHKVGELPQDTYQSSAQNLRATIERLDQQIDEFKRFEAAQSSSDLVIPAKRPAPVVEQAPLVKPPPASPAMPPSASPIQPSSAPPIAPPITSDVLRPTKTGKNIKLPGRKWLAIIGGAIVLAVIIIVAVLLLVPGGDTSVSEVKIPVNIKGASNIGSLHFELVYDPTKLAITSISNGALLNNAILKYSNAPGILVCGMVSSKGIKGDGPAVTINFQVTGKDNTVIPLAMENVAAYDGASLNKLSVSAVDGNFSPRDGSFIPPTLTFTPAPK
jgi:hypothetical protein